MFAEVKGEEIFSNYKYIVTLSKREKRLLSTAYYIDTYFQHYYSCFKNYIYTNVYIYKCIHMYTFVYICMYV